MVTVAHGSGQMIFSTLSYPLSNRGLKEKENGPFVLSILSLIDDGGTIWFDEWHHGVRASASGPPSGLGQWLVRSRPGQAILYSATVLFVWLWLSGTRLGPPITQRQSEQRRAPVEHAQALANLSRRAGHGQAIRNHYRSSLKMALGERSGVSPALPDDDFLKRLASRQPDLETQRLNRLLTTLGQNEVSESEMIELARQVAAWINR